MAKRKKQDEPGKPAARVGGKKNQGWTNNARRAAARKHPIKAKAGAAVVETAMALVKIKKRDDKKADAPDASSPVNLGPIVLPSAHDAVRVLGELADLNDAALNAKKAWIEQKNRTKSALAKYDDLMDQVTEKLRLATHGSSAPLFDIVEREEDQALMEEAWAAGGQTTAHDPVFEASGGVTEVPGAVPDPDPEPAVEDETGF